MALGDTITIAEGCSGSAMQSMPRLAECATVDGYDYDYDSSWCTAAGDFSDTAVQGKLVHDMRYLASVVTNCFGAFGEIIGMQARCPAPADGHSWTRRGRS